MVKKVLFLSSANSARSQMAEAFLRALAGDAFEAYSAGSVPRDLHPLALAVMAERGIDIGEQRPKGLQEYIGTARVRPCHHRLRSRREGLPRVSRQGDSRVLAR